MLYGLIAALRASGCGYCSWFWSRCCATAGPFTDRTRIWSGSGRTLTATSVAAAGTQTGTGGPSSGGALDVVGADASDEWAILGSNQ